MKPARPRRTFVLVAALTIAAVSAAIIGVFASSQTGQPSGLRPPSTSMQADPVQTHVLSPSPTTGPQSGYDVVAILGQSNAQGAGYPSDPVLDAGREGLDQFADSGPEAQSIIPAVDSLFHVSQWLSPTGAARVGPGMQFGRDLLGAEPSDRHVLLVPAAQGSTSLTGDAAYSWNPADTTAAVNLYTNALSQIDRALALNPGNRLVAVIWAQGESDAGLTTGAIYQSRLLSIVDGVQQRYGAVPFLIGGMVPEWVQRASDRQSIADALESMPELRSSVRYVPGVPGENQDDALHYSAAGARAMGDRYFAAFKSFPATNAPAG
ncbi:sialate O-acetylesterase [Subtercola boreus]|uniref:Sialate O-acetylesterase domain-containing protein n=1 Tax=Subtercola boreus TaxID=120213 RepID=A0A3E0W9L8_9MICO|nr:sialate O-acetylesterase [Subtercola boreus]RFA19411.1 hypothetical protein B7R24_12290 [Subtercola boreus]RFA19672.1 hypothetical protein B7R23_12270 [Subtercola boreus]RFA26037.1 hypothetical protein B7R25_12390 [Subtercola boreus]